MSWTNLIAVASGGALGASTRYGINQWFVRQGWYGLPAATFAGNVLGWFLAGGLLVWVDTRLQGALWGGGLFYTTDRAGARTKGDSGGGRII